MTPVGIPNNAGHTNLSYEDEMISEKPHPKKSKDNSYVTVQLHKPVPPTPPAYVTTLDPPGPIQVYESPDGNPGNISSAITEHDIQILVKKGT